MENNYSRKEYGSLKVEILSGRELEGELYLMREGSDEVIKLTVSANGGRRADLIVTAPKRYKILRRKNRVKAYSLV